MDEGRARVLERNPSVMVGGDTTASDLLVVVRGVEPGATIREKKHIDLKLIFSLAKIRIMPCCCLFTSNERESESDIASNNQCSK